MPDYPNWYYNELQQVGIDFSNPALVAEYERKQGVNIAVDEQLIQQLGIQANHTLIDMGAGTGVFTRLVSRHCQRVYAVDVSQTMLNYAQQKAQAENRTNIEFHHSGFLTYEHEAPPVDVVFTRFALHHLPDFWKMVALTRIAKMLKTNGILYLRDVIFSFEAKDYVNNINAWIDRIGNPERFTKEDFETHIRDEYSTYSWLLEAMLQHANFEILEIDYHSPEYAAYICRKKG